MTTLGARSQLVSCAPRGAILGQVTPEDRSDDTGSLWGPLFRHQGALPAFAVFPVPAAQSTGKAASLGVWCPELSHIMGWHLLLPFTLDTVLWMMYKCKAVTKAVVRG